MDSDEYGIDWNPKKEKKARGADQNASFFKSLSEHERVYLQSHIYGGSCTSEKKRKAIYREGQIVLDDIFTPYLLLRFFIEILSNATDNVIKSRYEGVNTDQITIEMKKKTITIRNGGLPIPIEPHPEVCRNGKFGTVIDFAFGTIGSGSNLDQDYERHTAGTNGIGSKLTNIFSTYFEVEAGDNIRGVHQKAVWTRNMFTKLSSECTPSYVRQNKKWVLDGEPYSGPNFTQITYGLDFRKFNQEHYLLDDFELFRKIAIDASFAVKVPIVFNGERFDYRDIDQLAKLVGGDEYKNRITIYQLKDCDKQLNLEKKELEKRIKTGEITPDLEICMICKPGGGFDTSYTNGVYNRDGGVHTNKVYKTILDTIKKIASEDKSVGLVDMDISSLNIKFLKSNAILILNYKCRDANFDSQMKDRLCSPEPKFSLSIENVNHIKKWKIFDVIYDKFNERKTNPNLKKRMRTEKFCDANFVGKAGYELEMIPCEGKSAGQYVDLYILELGKLLRSQGYEINGKDIFAKLELFGKLKNISGLSNQKIDMPERSGKDNVFVNFMNAMGFVDGVDYETDEGANSLRYKKCRVIVDADNDGSHILCLLINFLYRRFPSFLKSGRLSWVYNPIIRAIHKKTGKTIRRFYSQGEYEDWRRDHPKVSHEPDYFKGLASVSPEQVAEDVRESANVVLWFDNEADIYLNIAFDQVKGSSTKRKDWILNFKEAFDQQIVKTKEDVSYAKISKLINTKLVEYSLETLPRCIPSNRDHLKHSIRIIIAYILEQYNFGKVAKKPMKADQIASGASEKFTYHHAASILVGVIAKLTHDFAGSNNLPFLNYVSMTGTREYAGKNSGAGRYIKGGPNWWVQFLFKKELYNLVGKNIVEGNECEPLWIPCLLPLAVINGTKGVSTGWSTEMTSYHPLDVLKWIYRYISNQDLFPMIPWFIRFYGDVRIEESGEKIKKNKKLEENEENEESDEEKQENNEEEEDEEPNRRSYVVLKTYGKYQIDREYQKEVIIEEEDPERYGEIKKVKKMERFTDFTITEVPIGIIPAKLVLELGKKCKELPMDQPEDQYTPKIIVKGYMGDFTPEDIGMVSSRKMTNIHLISPEGIPIKYKNVYDVLADYCDNIINLYKKRKRIKIEELEKELEVLSQKKYIVKLVIDKEWTYINRKRKDVKDDLFNMKIQYDIFKSLSSDQYTEEGFDELIKNEEKTKIELERTIEIPAVQEWKNQLKEFAEELEIREEYRKIEKHEYPIVNCKLGDLISGRIYSPFCGTN